ncbi:MAG: hypothetical protein ACYDB1_00755 [Acidiferrobacteraceae bacterium]
MKVQASAIKHREKVYALPPPAKHPDIIRHWHHKGLDISKGQRGFILSDGTFANRHRAYMVAKRANQIRKEMPAHRTRLHSEDVW